ncbi:receptor-interacting serine/threonine-protein kinase 4-like isoform X2 [Oscarella lobularis]|uniref:receptor-interacting serine/threonine-protein kinase 4-like isoform X2 n=1 Tax=Oscarella lobularis TaxID=121494 RepID=UPI0033132CF8
MADPLWNAKLRPVQDKVVLLISGLLNCSLLDALVAKNLLSDEDYESVRAMRKQSNTEAARELISLLKKKPSPTFDTFCKTLRGIEDGGVSRNAILKELQVTSCSALARDAATNPAAGGDGGDRANVGEASWSCKSSSVERDGEHQPSFPTRQLNKVERTDVVTTCTASSFSSAKKAKLDDKPLGRSSGISLSSRLVIEKLITIIEGRHDPQSVNELKSFLSTEKGFRSEQFFPSSSVLRFVAGREFKSAKEAAEWLSYLVWEKNKDVNVSSRHGAPPIHSACEWGNIFGVQWLVNNGATVNVKDKSERTPYYYACTSSTDALKKILFMEEHGYASLPTDIVFAAERSFSSSKEADEFFCHFVVEKGMNVNATDKVGDSPLHSACWFGSIFGVKWLAENKAALNKGDDSGITPFMRACQSRTDRLSKVRYLDEKGADYLAKDNFGRTALHYATYTSQCEEDVKEVIKYLIRRGIGIESVDQEEQTPLLHSYCLNPPSHVAIQQLIESGADVFAKNKSKETALHLAEKNDNTTMPIIDLLIEKIPLCHDSIPVDAWSDDSMLDVYRGQRYQCNNPADIISPSSLVILQCYCFYMANISYKMWKKLLKLVDDKKLECLIKMGVKKGHHCIDVILRWSSKAACKAEAKGFLDELKSMITKACIKKSPGVCLNWFYLDSSHLQQLEQDPAIYSSEEVNKKVKERNFKHLIFSTRPERETHSPVEDLVVLVSETSFSSAHEETVSNDLMKACAAVGGSKWEDIAIALGISLDERKYVRDLTCTDFSRMFMVLEFWKKQTVSPTVGQLLYWFNEFGINRRSIEEKLQQHCQY